MRDTIVSHKSRELVVLVHGMGRSTLSMLPLAIFLKRSGYKVMNWGYSSRRRTVAEIGGQLANDLEKRRSEYDRVHFVGHSLGTVIIRWVLAQEPRQVPAGRVVMLAPPNQGSRAADVAARYWSWALKPLPELTTAATSTARVLPALKEIPVAIIAGKYDGKVAVEETHIEGETVHIVVPAAHSFLMLRGDVQRLTLAFLQQQ